MDTWQNNGRRTTGFICHRVAYASFLQIRHNVREYFPTRLCNLSTLNGKDCFFFRSTAGSAETLIKLPSFQVAGPTRIGGYLPLIAWARVQQPLFWDEDSFSQKLKLLCYKIVTGHVPLIPFNQNESDLGN